MRMPARRNQKVMDMPPEGYNQAYNAGGPSRFVQVMPPPGFVTGAGDGKSDVILDTQDPKGLFFDFNRDNVLYNTDQLLQHVRSGGVK